MLTEGDKVFNPIPSKLTSAKWESKIEVAWRAISTEQDLRIPLLQQTLDELASKRGIMRARPNQTPGTIEKIDAKLAQELSNWTQAFLRDPQLANTLFEKFKFQELNARLGQIEDTVCEISEKIGATWALHTDDDRVAGMRGHLQRYIEAQNDLSSIIPDLKIQLEQIAALAEQRGLSLGTAAERAALLAHKDINQRRWRVFFDRNADKLWNDLLKFDADELAYVSEAYKECHGKSINNLARIHYAHVGGERIINLLNGNLAEALADNFYHALTAKIKIFTLANDEKQIYKRLMSAIDQTPVSLLPEVFEAFLNKYGKHFSPENHKSLTLEDIISSKIEDPYYTHILLARIRRDSAYTDAIKLRNMLRTGTQRGVEKALEVAEKYLLEGNIKDLKRAFTSAFRDYTIDEYITKFAARCELKQALLLALKNDEESFRYQKLLYGLHHLGGTLKIGEAFSKTTADMRDKLQKRFESEHHFNLEFAFRHFPKEARSNLMSIIKYGDLKPHQKLRYGMRGWGTDVDLLVDTSKSHTRKENIQIAKDYKAEYYDKNPNFIERIKRRFPLNRVVFVGKLRNDLRKEVLSGDEKFDVHEARRGKPKNDEERYQAIIRRYNHEKSAAYLIRLKFGSGCRLTEAFNKLNNFYEAKIKDRTPTKMHTQQFRVLMENVEMNLKPFRYFKEKISPILPNIGAGVATAGSLAVLTKFKFTWMVTAPISFITCMSVLSTAKQITKGRGYGTKEFISDWTVSAINAGTFYSARLFVFVHNYFSNSITNSAIKGVTKTGMKQMVRFAERFGKNKRDYRQLILQTGTEETKTKPYELNGLKTKNSSHHKKHGRHPHDLSLHQIWSTVLK